MRVWAGGCCRGYLAARSHVDSAALKSSAGMAAAVEAARALGIRSSSGRRQQQQQIL